MKRFYIYNIIYVFILLGITSCNLFKKNELEPKYIYVKEVFGQNQSKEQSLSHNIVDVWASTNELSLGLYTIPATFPVLTDDEEIIILEAGIYVDGFTGKRSKYFFYRPIIDTITSIDSNEITLTPRFEYLTNTVFSELGSDDFESSIKRFKTENGEIINYVDDDFAFEGTSAVVRNTDSQNKTLKISSKTDFKIQNDKVNAPVFLEFDLKSNVQTTIGITVKYNDDVSDYDPKYFFSTNDEWRHIYIDLTNGVNLVPEDATYNLYFKADTTKLNDYIGLDNVRILYIE